MKIKFGMMAAVIVVVLAGGALAGGFLPMRAVFWRSSAADKPGVVVQPERPVLEKAEIQGATLVLEGSAPPGMHVGLRRSDGKMSARAGADLVGRWKIRTKSDDAAVLRLVFATGSEGQPVWQSLPLLHLPSMGAIVALTEGETEIVPLALTKPEPEASPVRLRMIRVAGQNILDLVGQAKPGTQLQVYLNDKMVGGALVGDKGDWHLRPVAGFQNGAQKLRFDIVDAEGKVSARYHLRQLSLPVESEPDDTQGLREVNPRQILWLTGEKAWTLLEAGSLSHDKGDPAAIMPGQVEVIYQDAALTDAARSTEQMVVPADKK